MKRHMILGSLFLLLWAPSGIAQPSATDIRKVDFQNFTYPSSLCSEEYGRDGIGKTVHVHTGEFKNKNIYFTVAADRTMYADMTGDGHEEAIVPIECGAVTANFARSEVYVYTLQNGSATLLAEVSDKDLERDYRHHYPDAESYWGINENGLKVENGTLKVDVLADGPHASPQHIVTLEYRLSGETLRLMGKPQRRSLGQ